MVDPSPSHSNTKRKHSSSSSTVNPASKSNQRQSIPPANTSKYYPTTKYSGALNKFIDMELIDIDPLRKWVRTYLETYHKEDAALLEDLVFERLTNERWPDPKVLQTELGDIFMLPLDAREFVKRLWTNLTYEVNSRSSSSRKRVRKD